MTAEEVAKKQHNNSWVSGGVSRLFRTVSHTRTLTVYWRGPRNNAYYLGHVKHVCDDDDDDVTCPLAESSTDRASHEAGAAGGVPQGGQV